MSFFPPGRLLKFKTSLKEAENELVRSLAGMLLIYLTSLQAEDSVIEIIAFDHAAKTRSEAKRMATMESISAVKTRVEELKNVLQDQKARRDEYAAIIFRESLGMCFFLFVDQWYLLLELARIIS